MYFLHQKCILFVKVMALLSRQRLKIPMKSYFFIDIWILYLHFTNELLLTNNSLLQGIDLSNQTDDLSKYFFLSIRQQRLPRGYNPTQRIQLLKRRSFILMI